MLRLRLRLLALYWRIVYHGGTDGRSIAYLEASRQLRMALDKPGWRWEVHEISVVFRGLAHNLDAKEPYLNGPYAVLRLPYMQAINAAHDIADTLKRF